LPPGVAESDEMQEMARVGLIEAGAAADHPAYLRVVPVVPGMHGGVGLLVLVACIDMHQYA